MNVVLMTGEGYPKKFSANNSKSEFIARGLKECGCSVSIIDGAFGSKGILEEIQGVTTDGINYHILPRIGRYGCFFRNLPKLYRVLKKTWRKGEVNHIIIGMERLPFLYVYFFIAKILGYSRGCLFHEWHAGFKGMSVVAKIEAYVRDFTFGYFINVIYPISHFLQEKSRKFRKRMMLIPVLADFGIQNYHQEILNHFTYCCAGEYLLRNTLVLDSFRNLLEKEKYRNIHLILVIQGNENVLKKTQELVRTYTTVKDNIVIKSKIPRQELDDLYASSIGLLIPLDPASIQDKARFSQKIAEYVALQRPIITSEVGEISFYFKNKGSAVIVPYDVQGYCDAMQFLADNMSKASEIGKNGFFVGKKFFDYCKCGQKLKEFLEDAV